MDEGFPFTGKWLLPKLLAEVRDEVADKDMPPASYMKKKGVAISAAERQTIVDWARSTEAALKPGFTAEWRPDMERNWSVSSTPGQWVDGHSVGHAASFSWVS